MSFYDVQVRGETVHIEFKRINDSQQRLRFGTGKQPNLFKIRRAMGCLVEMPMALCPGWAKEDGVMAVPFSGMSFCHISDAWSARAGRHHALKDALTYDGCDVQLNEEITAAFTLLEASRMKVKGPASKPKTAKPKPPRPSLRKVLAQLQETLERINHPLMSAQADRIDDNIFRADDGITGKILAQHRKQNYLGNVSQPFLGAARDTLGCAHDAGIQPDYAGTAAPPAPQKDTTTKGTI